MTHRFYVIAASVGLHRYRDSTHPTKNQIRERLQKKALQKKIAQSRPVGVDGRRRAN